MNDEAFASRFWDGVDVRADDECWLWRRSRTPNGYGKMTVKHFGVAHTHSVHRIAWELTHGEIPDGLCVLHHCDNRRCCSPDHLFLGTKADNTDDMITKGRHRRRKTYCIHGHLFAGENVALTAKGSQRCRACTREATRRYRERTP